MMRFYQTPSNDIELSTVPTTVLVSFNENNWIYFARQIKFHLCQQFQFKETNFKSMSRTRVMLMRAIILWVTSLSMVYPFTASTLVVHLLASGKYLSVSLVATRKPLHVTERTWNLIHSNDYHFITSDFCWSDKKCLYIAWLTGGL